MIRKFFLLLIMAGAGAIVLTAAAFYLLNTQEPLTGFEQHSLSSPPEKPAQLTATFIGTSTLLFSDGRHSIMVDGFFTRPSIKTLLSGKILPDIPLIKSSLSRLNVTHLDAIMVAHSHHDHAMDAPTVAELTQATLFGSESTANIARSAGLPEDQIAVVGDKRSLTFGQFTVTMIKAKHTPVPSAMAWLTGNGENINKSFPQQPRLTDFNEGGSYVMHIEHPLGNVLVQASGGYIEGLLKPYQADTVFLGIAGLSKQSEAYKQHYFDETLAAVNAKKVIPVHWDNFMRPIGNGLVPAHPLIDNIQQSISDLSNYMGPPSTESLIIMQAWDTISINQIDGASTNQ